MKFKTPLQIAVFFAALGVAGKLAVYVLHLQHIPEVQFYIVVYYLVLLLFTVFFGIRQYKLFAEKETGYFDDVKAGVRAGMLFAMIIGLVTYFYYNNIDTDFFEIRRQEVKESVVHQAKEMLKQGKSKEEINAFLKNQFISMETMLTPYFQTIMTVFGMTFMAFFNALIFAVFMRKFPGFKKT
tara:strand:- start:18704 stop:19252 length:549 start_codon:yes stop_codon:yes gene_type:complete